MSVFSYDSFNFIDRPSIILCNPDKSELYSLGLSFNTKLSMKYNALSEFKFDLNETVQDSNGNNIDNPAYALLKDKRVVFIDGIGYFQISKVVENKDGTIPIKSVDCTSLESELTNKQLNAFSGTLKFYDPVSPTGTLMNLILAGTGWTIGNIDVDLYNIYRTFDISSNTVYNTLMTTIETAYGCIFTFDTYNRKVNAIALDNANTSTDIFISFNNLIKTLNFTEIADEVATALSVYGGADLDIRAVNPLGTNKIYDFSYYQSTSWMSQGLINALIAWKALITSHQSSYATLLTQLRTQNIDLSTLQTNLSILQDTLSGLIEQQKAKIEQGLDLSGINTQIAAQNVLITTQNTSITNKQSQIATTTTQIIAVNTLLSFSNNFTAPQLLELNPFIIENVYQNDNIIITDIMTPSQLQDQAQELYNQAITVLAKTATPRYEFEMETANILALKEFEQFSNQLILGALVTIESKEGVFVETGLLEINISFDNLDDFKLVFSNRLRLDNGSFVYSDMFGQVVKTGTSVSFNGSSWSNWSDNYKGDVTNFITSSLDASKNAVINASNQEIVIDQHGLRGRKSTGGTTYSPNQVWLTNTTLAFTKDSFATASLALGQITFNGQTLYGIVAGAIIGDLIAGSQLIISNSNNTFRVDSSGATLTNASLTLNGTGPNIVTLNQTSGITITKRSNGAVLFSTDGSGNLHLTGGITATSGSFTGTISSSVGNIGSLVIDSNGLKTSNGVNYLRGDGSLNWGPLNISGNTGTFNGSFQASKLIGQITNPQIGSGAVNDRTISDLSANKINAGFINGITIFGSTIGWGGTFDAPNVKMYGIDKVGVFQAVTSVQLFAGEDNNVLSTLFIEPTALSLYIPGGNGVINLGLGFGEIIKVSGTLNLSNVGTLITPGGNGLTQTFVINTTVGNRIFNFNRGILVSVT